MIQHFQRNVLFLRACPSPQESPQCGDSEIIQHLPTVGRRSGPQRSRMVHGELLHHLPHDVVSSFILLPSSIRSAGESVADWLQNHWPLNEQAASEADHGDWVNGYAELGICNTGILGAWFSFVQSVEKIVELMNRTMTVIFHRQLCPSLGMGPTSEDGSLGPTKWFGSTEA